MNGRLLLVLLLGSIALNLLLLASRWRGATGHADGSPVAAAGTEPSTAGAKESDGPRLATAPVEGLLRSLVSATRAEASSPTDAERGGLMATADLATQEDMLGEIARRTAAEEWSRKAESITAGLRSSLADPEEQERNIRQVCARMSRLLSLEPEEAARLEQAYREVRLDRLRRIRTSLEPEQPDYGAVLEEARALFADEDRLVAECCGAEARDRLRLAELEGRTAILAIAASLAGLPWDRAVGW